MFRFIIIILCHCIMVINVYILFFHILCMRDDIGHRNYRKIVYFYKNKIPVHFKDTDEIFYNGIILELNEKKLTMVLKERINGILPILLECIKEDSICEYKEK